ncbi:MAG: hypothetical protein ABFD79_01420 [Phycisphaerales bacterium]
MISALTFERGLALLNDLKNVYCLVDQERDVELKSFGTVGAGYVEVCHQYVRRWLNEGHGQQVPLPRLEDLLKGGGVYINPFAAQLQYPVFRAKPNGEPLRYFSLVAPFVCAYVDSLDNLFSIIYQYKLQYIHFKEFRSVMEAREYMLDDYKVTQMSIGAYFNDIICHPSELQLNDVFYDERGMVLPQFTKTISMVK